jgi:hypothetical protein
MSSLDLLAGDDGLFWRQVARLGLALHGAGKAEVGTMTSLGVFTTGTSRLAAFDHAFRQRTSTHGLNFG